MSNLKRPRTPDQADDEPTTLKSGERPQPHNGVPHEAGDFEDEFEDEFESEDEDEIFEAGVDGRPDAEREAEEGV
jgi:ribosome assembly protein RRB1